MGVGDVVALVAGVIENFEFNLADDDDERLNISLGFLWYDFDFSTTRTTIVCDDLFLPPPFCLSSPLRIMRVTLGLAAPTLLFSSPRASGAPLLPPASFALRKLLLSHAVSFHVSKCFLCIVINPSTRNLCTYSITIYLSVNNRCACTTYITDDLVCKRQLFISHQTQNHNSRLCSLFASKKSPCRIRKC